MNKHPAKKVEWKGNSFDNSLEWRWDETTKIRDFTDKDRKWKPIKRFLINGVPRYSQPEKCSCFNCMGDARWVSKTIVNSEGQGYLGYCENHRAFVEMFENDFKIEFIDREKVKDDN